MSIHTAVAKANIFSSAFWFFLYTERLFNVNTQQCTHGRARRGGKAHYPLWKEWEKMGKFSLFMTFNFSLLFFPSPVAYHRRNVYSIAIFYVLYTPPELRCARFFLKNVSHIHAESEKEEIKYILFIRSSCKRRLKRKAITLFFLRRIMPGEISLKSKQHKKFI